jgi:hypothetical protein
VNTSIPGFFCVESIFLLLFQYHCLLSMCLVFLYTLGSILISHLCLEICKFSSRLSNLLKYVFKRISIGPLDFDDIRFNISFSFSKSIGLGLLFVLVSLAKSLLILIIFSKNQLFISLIFYIILLDYISLIST